MSYASSDLWVVKELGLEPKCFVSKQKLNFDLIFKTWPWRRGTQMMIFHQYVTWGPPHIILIHQETSGLQRPGRRVVLYHGRDVVAAPTLGTIGEEVWWECWSPWHLTYLTICPGSHGANTLYDVWEFLTLFGKSNPLSLKIDIREGC